ncbi:NrfD/PsrC family molybdoenzyme membrane anchor subunit [Adlercreutzia sp. R25]|uniref:NrfD/PsrC family molybdoenzyme membrane anchor subunit n=1 Tax=Adlercreutzia shanghongiae TaxID=3111773 RepID=UPI002DB885B3|nr:NrfD/PsrC family molybdoenzyme membrane anchor subunit [Adlercreutzia sp. R25]MEC4272843.1 NrfD/PsrC family molybdoenzyme membrane anchor subunit [Adlercreutzia sp. R25]
MFSELVVAYLFLGGTGAGACAIMAVAGLLVDGEQLRLCAASRFLDERGQAYGRFFGAGLAAGVAALALGIVCLMADVGRPDRLVLLVVSEPTNYLVLGAWSLVACFGLGVLGVLAWRGVLSVRSVALRGLSALLAAVSFVTMAYTGLLLSSMASVPLWHNLWLPVMFVLSSLSCGIALVLATTLLGRGARAFAGVLRALVCIDGLVIAAEVLVLTAWLVAVCAAAGVGSADAAPTPTDTAALASVRLLLEGPGALAFWVGLVGVGLVVPLAINAIASFVLKPSRSASMALPRQVAFLVSALGVLIGGACLRATVVSAALVPAAVGLL